MFTGIVSAQARVTAKSVRAYGLQLLLDCPQDFVQGISIGGSVAVDGVCLTVTAVEGSTLSFDVIGETIERTTLGNVAAGARVNIERSARFSDEIGGHIVSGHVATAADIVGIASDGDRYIVQFRIDQCWMSYLFSKGFIAIDGISLTLVDVDIPKATFTVHLIPETLGRTTLGFKGPTDRVNVEIDNRTQVIVETVQRLLPEYLSRDRNT